MPVDGTHEARQSTYTTSEASSTSVKRDLSCGRRDVIVIEIVRTSGGLIGCRPETHHLHHEHDATASTGRFTIPTTLQRAHPLHQQHARGPIWSYMQWNGFNFADGDG